MKRYLTVTAAIGLLLAISGEALAGGRRGARSKIQRYWRPSTPVAPHSSFHFHHRFYPHSYFRHDPGSVIIITPYSSYPYHAPFTIVTREPFYCHVHHVGFVSRAGFLDHVSGSHKIPLETVNALCAYGEESCVIEGY